MDVKFNYLPENCSLEMIDVKGENELYFLTHYSMMDRRYNVAYRVDLSGRVGCVEAQTVNTEKLFSKILQYSEENKGKTVIFDTKNNRKHKISLDNLL